MSQPHKDTFFGKKVSRQSASLNPRFEAANILLDHGISCVIWGEDALQHYGSRTVNFDLFLIVEDQEATARRLEIAGYSRALPNPRDRFIKELQSLPRFKKGPFSEIEEDDSTYVVLVRAHDVRYVLPPAHAITDLIPPLPALLDSIIDAWLDANTTSYALHLACHLAYLQSACPRARDPDIISELKPGHRDFYRRALLGSGIGAERQEWRRVRDSFPEVT